MDNQTVRSVAIDILIVRMRRIVNLLYLVSSTMFCRSHFYLLIMLWRIT